MDDSKTAPPPAPHQVATHAHGKLVAKIVIACGLIGTTIGPPLLAKLSPILGAQSGVIIAASAIVAAAGAIGHALVDSAFLGATDNS